MFICFFLLPFLQKPLQTNLLRFFSAFQLGYGHVCSRLKSKRAKIVSLGTVAYSASRTLRTLIFAVFKESSSALSCDSLSLAQSICTHVLTLIPSTESPGGPEQRPWAPQNLPNALPAVHLDKISKMDLPNLAEKNQEIKRPGHETINQASPCFAASGSPATRGHDATKQTLRRKTHGIHNVSIWRLMC